MPQPINTNFPLPGLTPTNWNIDTGHPFHYNDIPPPPTFWVSPPTNTDNTLTVPVEAQVSNYFTSIDLPGGGSINIIEHIPPRFKWTVTKIEWDEVSRKYKYYAEAEVTEEMSLVSSAYSDIIFPDGISLKTLNNSIKKYKSRLQQLSEELEKD